MPPKGPKLAPAFTGDPSGTLSVINADSESKTNFGLELDSLKDEFESFSETHILSLLDPNSRGPTHGCILVTLVPID